MKVNLIILAISTVMLAACKEKKETSAAMPVLPIDVAYPEVRTVTLTKDYPGYLSSDKKVDLMARVNGVLQSVNFQPGTRVTQGQLLFVIEPTLYRNAVVQAEAEVQTAEAQLDYARNQYDRMKEAIKSDAVSKIQLLQAQSSVAEGMAAVDNARAALNTAKTNLGYCYVRAPFNGTIDRTLYDVGSYISGSLQPATLSTIYKDDRMYAYFNVADNQWLSMLMSDNESSLPHEVTVRLGKDGAQTYPGKLDYLSPSVNLSTGTLDVRANMDNPKGILKSGLYVSITLPYGEQKDAVLVRDASIGTDQLGKYLYVVNDSNIVRYRHIQTGQLIGDTMRLVTNGLAPQERYVTKALIKVRDGMEIKPVVVNHLSLTTNH